jgi:hypothetical protein
MLRGREGEREGGREGGREREGGGKEGREVKAMNSQHT